VLTVGLEVAKLDEVTLRPHAGLLEVPGERLVHRLLLLLEPAELDGGVAVRGRCLALHHGARTGQQDRDRNEPVALPDLGHAHFGAEDAFPSYRPPTVLISISAPVGRSRCIRESMVLLVGDLMSISLLCVRISKCSRLSLSTNGPRSTQNRRMRVGSGTGPATLAPVRLTVSTILVAELSRLRWSNDLSLMRIFGAAMVTSSRRSRRPRPPYGRPRGSRSAAPPPWRSA